MRITKLPKATMTKEDDITLIVQDGETRQIPRTLLAPPVTVDAEMSETSENSVQNKAITAAIQELETGVNEALQDQTNTFTEQMEERTPTDLNLENNNLHLTVGEKTIGNGIVIPHMEVLNDITLAEDVTDITRAADDSGKPFKLKEFFLIFAGKCPSEANGVVRLRFNGGLIYSAYHRYTFPKNTDDTNRLLWFHSKKLFDGAYLSTYASQFIRDTDGNDAVVNGQIRCQGLINSNCSPHSDLYFRFPVENTANFQTASSWQFGVTGDLKLLAGSRIIALGVRE